MTTFNQETLAGLLDEELARAIERLHSARDDLKREIYALEQEQARRRQRRKEATR